MEIYKLGDEKLDEASSCRLKITDIRQGVKNPERVNVFVNGKYSFSLEISQVVDFKIKAGQEISEEKLEELKRASEFGKLYQKTLEWVLVRPRSERETREYLLKKTYKKELDKNINEQLIDKLKSKKYVDDEAFARWYVQNRFVKKGISKKRLKMELIKKGISGEIIDEVLNGRDDEEEIKKIIAKKRGRYDDEKLIQYLCRQGFSFELARDLVRDFGKD